MCVLIQPIGLAQTLLKLTQHNGGRAPYTVIIHVVPGHMQHETIQVPIFDHLARIIQQPGQGTFHHLDYLGWDGAPELTWRQLKIADSSPGSDGSKSFPAVHSMVFSGSRR